MDQDEKNKLHKAEFAVEQLLTKIDCRTDVLFDLRNPSFDVLLDMLACLRIGIVDMQLNLEATQREKAALEKGEGTR